jgi:DNA gyrase subunit A
MSRRPPNKPTRRRRAPARRRAVKARAGDGNGSGDQQALVLGSVEPVEIQEEMERSFLEYSMSVITQRALPDARDGLKPVQRRILYTMLEDGLRPDRVHVKSAEVVGHVIARYHPHGLEAVYDAMVRLAQDFSVRYPLVDGHGNFGSPDHEAGAFRYTEARLAPLALEMLAGIDENTVDFRDNYSASRTEPVVLPSRFPNLLVNGSQGIAVAMATNIPTHNLGEVIDATIHVLDNPKATSKDLMKFVKGPDFPTGGMILGRQGIRDAYTTGRGSIKIRGKAEIEEGRKGTQIVVTELPYQTSVGSVAGRIADLVNSKQLEGVRNVLNASAQGENRLII